jgi:hypothetical protein
MSLVSTSEELQMKNLMSLTISTLFLTTTVACNSPNSTIDAKKDTTQKNKSQITNTQNLPVLVPAGTTFEAKLQEDISTGKNRDRDRFVLREHHSLIGGNSILKDAQIKGHLEDVVKAARGKKAKLHLVFDNIVLKDGTVAPLNVILVNTQVETKKKGRFLKNVSLIIGGTVVGHFLGKRTGNKYGALSGLTTASAAVLFSPGGEVVLKKGTEIKLKFKEPLRGARP